MTSAERHYAEVIGDPVDHSLSPLIHGFWLSERGVQADYRRRRVGRGELREYVAGAKADPLWLGCNVTMPLKLDALAQADDPTDRALGAGAANILLPRNGRIEAGNTDVGGVHHLLQRLDVGGGAERVVVLGSGGAARAALMALHLLGQRDVEIHSRDTTGAYKLAVQFGLSVEPRPFGSRIACDGLINATPLGMHGSPSLEVDLGGVAQNGWVVDFVSVPPVTALINDARAKGLRTVDGLQILVEQAHASFRLFFGAEPPRERDEELMRMLRK